jgi:cation:H+ antiporter
MELTVIEAFMLSIGALGFGIILLIRGGDWTIDAAIYIARKAGVSPLVVGFTIVAFGTSLPELLVSINANLSGSPGIAIGNVLGSNIANILLVIGATATVCTIHVVPRQIARDLILMLAATILFAALLIYGDITRMSGFAMIAVLLAYVLWQYIKAQQGQIPMEEIDNPEFKNLGKAVLFLIVGLGAIALGAEFLVRGAKTGALIIGVPEAVIGLSIIAIGTSLPELTTCLIAAARKQPDLILGNIIGSNVFNILMIIGVTSSIKPIAVSSIAPQLVDIDIWLTMGVSVAFTAILLIYQKIPRFLGVAFLVAYFAYIIAIYALYLVA